MSLEVLLDCCLHEIDATSFFIARGQPFGVVQTNISEFDCGDAHSRVRPPCPFLSARRH